MSAPTSNATEAVLAELYAQPDIPPLEPGDKVYSAELRERIKGLREHKYTIAGTCVHSVAGFGEETSLALDE